MGDAVFRVGADVSDYVNKMAVAERSTKRVGKAAASIGDQVTGSIVKVELLTRALNAAGRAVSNVLDKAEAASKSAGSRAVSLATNLDSLGVDAGGMGRLTSTVARGSPYTTAEQGAALVRSLAAAAKDRRSPMGGADAESLIKSAIGGGELAYGEGFRDLLTGFSGGLPASDIISTGKARAERIRRIAAGDPLSPLSQELEARAEEAQQQFTEEKALGTPGTRRRVETARMKSEAARNPTGLVSFISGFSETAATFMNTTREGIQEGATPSGSFEGPAAPAAAPTGGAQGPLQALTRTIGELGTSFRRVHNAPNFATDTQ